MKKIGPFVIATAKEISQLAYRDRLTGLANRAMFDDNLTMLMAETDRGEHKLGLLFLDLNGFKKINDSLGHAVGDQVLKIFGGSIVGCVRKSDVVARFGGDEFAVIVPNIHGEPDLQVIANKIAALSGEPLRLAGRELWVFPSIGSAIYPDDAANAEVLVRLADEAMYKAKLELRHYIHTSER